MGGSVGAGTDCFTFVGEPLTSYSLTVAARDAAASLHQSQAVTSHTAPTLLRPTPGGYGDRQLVHPPPRVNPRSVGPVGVG